MTTPFHPPQDFEASAGLRPLLPSGAGRGLSNAPGNHGRGRQKRVDGVGVGGSRKRCVTENAWGETMKDHVSRLGCEHSSSGKEAGARGRG